MAISKARKQELVEQYSGLIEQSNALFVTGYAGLSVKQLEALRQKVRESEGAIHVTKNTLLQLALNANDKPVDPSLYAGQLATGFALGEAPTLAKALVDFAKDEDHLEIRFGILGDDILTTEQVEALADLPTLDQLRGQILGLINAPAQGIVSAVTSGVRQVINVVDAYAKSEENASESEA